MPPAADRAEAERPLDGRTIGVTADRKRDTLAKLLTARGAAVRIGPTLEIVEQADDPALAEATEVICAEPPVAVVLDTGAGVRSWFDAAERWGSAERLRAALARSTVVARGAKAASAAKSLGLSVAAVGASERLADLRAPLSAVDVADRPVAVQMSGEADRDGVVNQLRQRGARVTVVTVHQWRLPADHGAARDLIAAALAGELDAVTFTSAPAVRNLFALAETDERRAQLRDAFAGPLLAGCVGPVCAEVARGCGIERLVFPEVGRLANFVRVLTDALR